ncbi:MAG: adenylate kinase family protein [Caldimicrobium sp.]
MLSFPIRALLLLGPTGAGKTPLGWELEKRRLFGKKIYHFDFGENLRKVAQGSIPFEEEDRKLIMDILKEGRLLKPEEFYLAEHLLNSFLTQVSFKKEDLLLLNGLPRNLYQAEKLSNFIEMEGVIYLKIDERTLFLRLKTDPAMDRKERTDDLEELVFKKLKWFREENLPLLEYYSAKGVKIIELNVFEKDTGESLYEKLIETWKNL